MPVNVIAMPFSFAAAIDSSSLIGSAETGDWGQACVLRFSVACHCVSEPDFEIAGSCGSSAEPLAVLKNEPVEIVLLDFDLGGDHDS